MSEEKYLGDAPLKKLELNEKIIFSAYVVSNCETRYGESAIVNFADASGKIFRKCFAQGGMLEFLAKNPEIKSLVLKNKLQDGQLTYNVWGVD